MSFRNSLTKTPIFWNNLPSSHPLKDKIKLFIITNFTFNEQFTDQDVRSIVGYVQKWLAFYTMDHTAKTSFLEPEEEEIVFQILPSERERLIYLFTTFMNISLEYNVDPF